MADGELIRTGIAGLDALFRPGIPLGNVLLVEGAIGTGKTLLGLEFIYRGVTQYQEPGMIVSFEVAPQKLIRDAANFGWDLAALQQQQRVKFLFTSPQVLSQELAAPDSLLLETAAEMGAQRIFIDGISLLQTVPPDVQNGDHGTGTPGAYRQLLQQLLEGLQREHLTALLSHEVTAIAQYAFALEITEYLVDTVIVLRREPHRLGSHRSLEITKSRGQDYDTGRHTLRITNGRGLEVFRRAQAPPHNLEQGQPTSRTRQSVIGAGPLDALFGGGVFEGSVTMVVGISGSGKTVLNTQLLLEGITHQQRGLMVSLDEHPQQVLRNVGTLGLDLQPHLDSGALQFFYDCPRELELDVHFAHITQTIEAHQIQRLIVDGMTSYINALQDAQQYREFCHALVNYCKDRQITTFLSYENPELFGVNRFMPDFPVSFLVDNIVLLNFVELGNTVHRAITVPKARGSANEFVTREFTIGPGGITLVPLDAAAALPVLPFQSYYGLLSRAPTRLSPNLPRGPQPPGRPADP